MLSHRVRPFEACLGNRGVTPRLLALDRPIRQAPNGPNFPNGCERLVDGCRSGAARSRPAAGRRTGKFGAIALGRSAPARKRCDRNAAGERLGDLGRSEPAGCLLYGPYLHLPQGRYRLSFRCRHGRPRMSSHPVLGVEIIVLSRFQQQWRDFTSTDLAGGFGALDFEVPPEHSLEGENEGRYEFRFFHLGNAALAITSVDLEQLSAEAPAAASLSRWRLLGRLDKSWRGRRTSGGEVAAWRHEPAGCLLYGGWPYLRLPGGQFRLVVQRAVRAGAAAGSAGARDRGIGRQPLAPAKLADAARPAARNERDRTRYGAKSMPTGSAPDRLRSILPCRPICRSRPGRTRRSTSGSITAAMRRWRSTPSI